MSVSCFSCSSFPIPHELCSMTYWSGWWQVYPIYSVTQITFKVTAYLQIKNFLQIWIFGSKYWSKSYLYFFKKILKMTNYWQRNRGFHVYAGSLPLDWQSYDVMQSTEIFTGLHRCEELATQKQKKRTKNENTAMNEQAKVGRKLKLWLWDQAYKRSIESREEKDAVIIVHALSGWLPSSYAICSTFLQHISWRVSFESAINKRKSSCHFTWMNGSIATWMFVHPTNRAVILDLKCH